MPKGVDKVKVNVKERVEDENCDLSLSELTEIPVREIVSKLYAEPRLGTIISAYIANYLLYWAEFWPLWYACRRTSANKALAV